MRFLVENPFRIFFPFVVCGIISIITPAAWLRIARSLALELCDQDYSRLSLYEGYFLRFFCVRNMPSLHPQLGSLARR